MGELVGLRNGELRAAFAARPVEQQTALLLDVAVEQAMRQQMLERQVDASRAQVDELQNQVWDLKLRYGQAWSDAAHMYVKGLVEQTSWTPRQAKENVWARRVVQHLLNTATQPSIKLFDESIAANRATRKELRGYLNQISWKGGAESLAKYVDSVGLQRGAEILLEGVAKPGLQANPTMTWPTLKAKLEIARAAMMGVSDTSKLRLSNVTGYLQQATHPSSAEIDALLIVYRPASPEKEKRDPFTRKFGG